MCYVNFLSDVLKCASLASRNMARTPLATGAFPQAGEVVSQGII